MPCTFLNFRLPSCYPVMAKGCFYIVIDFKILRQHKYFLYRTKVLPTVGVYLTHQMYTVWSLVRSYREKNILLFLAQMYCPSQFVSFCENRLVCLLTSLEFIFTGQECISWLTYHTILKILLVFREWSSTCYAADQPFVVLNELMIHFYRFTLICQ